jgi:hypothetical protein
VDSFWSGAGGGLIGVGAMYFAQRARYQKNEEYREAMDAERNDERNKFLSMKAWEGAGGCFVVIAAIGAFAFKFAGREDLMMLASGSVCLIILLYWGSWMVLRKKY